MNEIYTKIARKAKDRKATEDPMSVVATMTRREFASQIVEAEAELKRKQKELDILKTLERKAFGIEFYRRHGKWSLEFEWELHDFVRMEALKSVCHDGITFKIRWYKDSCETRWREQFRRSEHNFKFQSDNVAAILRERKELGVSIMEDHSFTLKRESMIAVIGMMHNLVEMEVILARYRDRAIKLLNDRDKRMAKLQKPAAEPRLKKRKVVGDN